MRVVRVYAASLILGLALALAAWLANYRVPVIREYTGADGRRFHPSQRSLEPAWWSAPAAVAVLALSIAAIVVLLPQRQRLRRLVPGLARPRRFRRVDQLTQP